LEDCWERGGDGGGFYVISKRSGLVSDDGRGRLRGWERGRLLLGYTTRGEVSDIK
jgi:hypothetical protein